MRTSRESTEVNTSELVEDETTYLDVGEPELGDIVWDGGERDPEGYFEVMGILEEHDLKEYERNIRRAAPHVEESDEELVNEEEINEEVEEVQPKKKRKIWVIMGCIIAFIACAGVFFFSRSSGDSLSDVQERVDRLYTSKEKVDIKTGITQADLDKSYSKLEEMPQKVRKKDSYVNLVEELNTIGNYLSDRDSLEGFEDENYDLSTPSFTDYLASIEGNSKGYTVSGLAVTAVNRCKALNDECIEYTKIKDELSNVKDPLNFQEGNYIDRIGAIKHQVNQKELSTMYDNILKEKLKATEKVNKDNKDKEAVERAREEELKRIQDEKKAVEEELQKTKDELKNTTDSVKDKLNSFLNKQQEENENQETEDVEEGIE